MARETDSNGKADFGSINFISDNTPYQVNIEASYTDGNVDVPIEDHITISE